MSSEKEIRQKHFKMKALKELTLLGRPNRPGSAHLLSESFQEAKDESVQGRLSIIR